MATKTVRTLYLIGSFRRDCEGSIDLPEDWEEMDVDDKQHYLEYELYDHGEGFTDWRYLVIKRPGGEGEGIELEDIADQPLTILALQGITSTREVEVKDKGEANE